MAYTRSTRVATFLIADSSKPSLVMTSEIFKDKNPGAVILVAKNGADVLSHLETAEPDLCVIDFDLPDVDGATLIAAMRKTYRGPILLTAYKDKIVDKAIEDLLFTYNDASRVIQKPVRKEDILSAFTKFIAENHRIDKRFDTEIGTILVGKAAGRGKRAPKVEGKMVNLSLGGACIAAEPGKEVPQCEEYTLTLTLPQPPKKSATTPDKATMETKVKAQIAWSSQKSGMIGLKFSKLTEAQKKGLIHLFRGQNT